MKCPAVCYVHCRRWSQLVVAGHLQALQPCIKPVVDLRQVPPGVSQCSHVLSAVASTQVVKSEMTVFKAIKHWMADQPGQTPGLLLEMLKAVR